MKRPEIIEAIRETLKRVAPNAQAILYGSEARGDARHDSDVDLLILVEGDKMTLAKEEAITLPLYELELKTWSGRYCLMKEILDKESKKALVAYRIQRAYETLREAEVMIRESFYNAAINRLYYACYYATVALLLKYDIQTQTHNGVKTMLGLHFISTGKLPVKVGKTFSTLFEKRHSGDYDDFVYCDEEMVNNLYPQAETFINSIQELIRDKEWESI